MFNSNSVITVPLKIEIENKLQSIDIYQHYISNDIKQIPYKCRSPFREENHPSFNIYINKGNLLWKDFTLGDGGNVYSFVMKLFGCDFNTALNKIKKDLLDRLNTSDKPLIYKTKPKIITSSINLKVYSFKEGIEPKLYFKYWNQYKVITKCILIKNKVSAVKYVFLNGKQYCRYDGSNIIISYKWTRKNDDKIYHKIYQPNNLDLSKKWLSNFRGNSRWLIHGLNLIDLSVNYIVITKSVKDKMVLEGLGFNSINVQNEGIQIPNKIIDYLLQHYDNIYLLYDNDYDKLKNWGQIASKNIIKQYPFIKNIKIDGRYKCTDISDFIKKYDIDKSKKYIQLLIN